MKKSSFFSRGKKREARKALLSCEREKEKERERKKEGREGKSEIDIYIYIYIYNEFLKNCTTQCVK